MNEKIGIFGGRFDPIHIGHLIVAQDVAEKLSLDRVIFLVSFRPPHKSAFTPFEHRFRMVQLATMDNPRFVASDFERRLNLARSYTVEVLRKMRETELKGKSIYFMMGTDQFLTLETGWYRPEMLFELARVVVLRRACSSSSAPSMSKFAEKAIFVNQRQIDLSSTEIRNRIRSGLSIRYLTPREVENYIYQHNLYSTEGKLWKKAQNRL